jgi:F-type H+-transporting ATPase subunit delta
MSDKSAKSQRYALAVFQALIEKWQTALADVSAALSKDQDRYSRLMDGSRTYEERVEALEGVLPADAPPEMANLLRLMLQEGDIDLLPEVSAALGQAVAGSKQPVRAEITSATELPDAQKQALQQALTQQFGEELVFYFGVDASLMGGLRVRVGDRLIDTSVATRLAALRESLASVVR